MATTLLAGKSAAITGGVTGIGRAIALEYLRQGASVAINYFPDEKSEEQYKSLVAEAPDNAKNQVIGVPGDIRQQEAGVKLVQAAVQSFGKLDIFVSNAGVCQFAEFLEFVFLLLQPQGSMLIIE